MSRESMKLARRARLSLVRGQALEARSGASRRGGASAFAILAGGGLLVALGAAGAMVGLFAQTAPEGGGMVLASAQEEVPDVSARRPDSPPEATLAQPQAPASRQRAGSGGPEVAALDPRPGPVAAARSVPAPVPADPASIDALAVPAGSGSGDGVLPAIPGGPPAEFEAGGLAPAPGAPLGTPGRDGCPGAGTPGLSLAIAFVGNEAGPSAEQRERLLAFDRRVRACNGVAVEVFGRSAQGRNVLDNAMLALERANAVIAALSEAGGETAAYSAVAGRELPASAEAAWPADGVVLVMRPAKAVTSDQ